MASELSLPAIITRHCSLFTAAREAGSAGPSSYYNIGVCQYRLRDYDAAEATFAALAAEFPAMRELAEYNRGLALRAQGNLAEARVAFERARASTDDKIVALANAQLGELGAARTAAETRWSGWFSGGLGYDDNVALRRRARSAERDSRHRVRSRRYSDC